MWTSFPGLRAVADHDIAKPKAMNLGITHAETALSSAAGPAPDNVLQILWKAAWRMWGHHGTIPGFASICKREMPRENEFY